jgi:hypothetical protein
VLWELGLPCWVLVYSTVLQWRMTCWKFTTWNYKVSVIYSSFLCCNENEDCGEASTERIAVKCQKTGDRKLIR